mgnify:CR=1 FL=1
MLCLIPLLLVGYSATIHTAWHVSQNSDAPYVQAQTCKTGLGLHGKVSAAPWASGGVHYGMTWSPSKDIELTVQPQVGLSYFNQHHPYGHRQIGRFEVGLALMVSYQRVHLNLEYTHLSNGEGSSPTNIGLDLVGLQVGYAF